MNPDKARAVTRALATREKSQQTMSERVKNSIAEAK
jgi:hypothetical protein